MHYIHLTAPPDALGKEYFVPDLLRRHMQWIESNGAEGERAIFDSVSKTGTLNKLT
jgi:hypothetical protein